MIDEFRFGFGGQPTPLVVREPWLLAELFPEHFYLFLQVFDYALLIPVQPTRQSNEQQLQCVG